MEIIFFALKDDLMRMLTDVASRIDVSLYPTGLHESETECESIDPRKIATLDLTPPMTSSIGGYGYLVMKQANFLNIREIIQHDGSTKYAVDQLHNPDTTIFLHGGVLGDSILHGRVSSAHDNKESKHLLSEFKRAISRNFRKVGTFYIGDSAYKLAKDGFRLTASIKSPREYDFEL